VTQELASLIAAMHERPVRLVYEFAGAGANALAWVRSVGGSSRTLLEAVDRYAPRSLAEVLAGADVQAVSDEAALALARHAALRADELAPGETVAGVGVTATIATDRQKRGLHRLVAALDTPLACHVMRITLTKGARTRAEEERVVSSVALGLMAEAKGVLPMLPLALGQEEVCEQELIPSELLADFLAGNTPMVAIDSDGLPQTHLPWGAAGGSQRPGETGGVMVSGAFNPLHDGHVGMADAAQRYLGRPLAFELPIINADKPELKALEVFQRARQFISQAPVILTRAPLFDQKAALLPNSVFVLGADTAARVLEARFYPGVNGLERSLDTVRAHGGRFLVAGRSIAGRFFTLADLDLPERHRDLFEALPEASFRKDVSSSEIRAAWSRPQDAWLT